MKWIDREVEARRLRDREASITGRRWCQHGAHYAPAETLGRIRTKNGSRSICAACQAKRNPGAQG